MRKKIYKIITNLIVDDGYKCYQHLPDDTKAALTAEMMLYADRTEFFDALVEAEESDRNVYALILYMRNDTTDNALYVADVLRKNAMAYYAEQLTAIFEKVYTAIENDTYRQQDLHPIIDSQTGETRWIK